MELIHKINDTIIEEPVGFDEFECKVSRGDYHGISAEVSVGSLEFYGSAYNTIKAAYEDDIDTKLAYAVTTDAGVSVFDGVLDLSTCEFQDSEYRSVSVKVGDIGKKTTFNNRTETDIDLNGSKTVDGADLEQPEWLEVGIPNKHLMYTNHLATRADKEYSEDYSGTALKTNYGKYGTWCNISFEQQKANEFGEAMPQLYVPSVNIAADSGIFGGSIPCEPLFRENGGFEDQFGDDTTVKVSINVDIDFTLQGLTIQQVTTGQTVVGLYLISDDHHVYASSNTYELNIRTEFPFTGRLSIHEDVVVPTESPLFLGINFITHIRPYQEAPTESDTSVSFSFSVVGGSEVKMTMLDNLPNESTDAKMISVHDALNVVTKAISENELSVKSSWYGSELSKWNAESGYGGGSLKAITNGYKIRGVYDEDRNMPVSFRTLIESLNAQDCIGWGFSQEGGSTCIRVERWSWFYKNATVLTLTDANEVHRSVDTGKIVTELKIGYKKYATTEQYNSIDSIHGVRTFTSGIKAISSKSERLCSFIADNYAIEEVRRLNGKETEQNSYDENIFVFELISEAERRVGGTTTVTIGHTATNAVDVGIASELINAKLSPRNMASRWRSYIFATAAPSDMRLTSGELNYKGSFGVIPQRDDRVDITTYSLATENTAAIQAEDADIENVRAAFRAETISFNYPLTIEQYKAVLNNPYGLIVVNGIPGWIKEFTYKINEGLASFKLIPKYEG